MNDNTPKPDATDADAPVTGADDLAAALATADAEAPSDDESTGVGEGSDGGAGEGETVAATVTVAIPVPPPSPYAPDVVARQRVERHIRSFQVPTATAVVNTTYAQYDLPEDHDLTDDELAALDAAITPTGDGVVKELPAWTTFRDPNRPMPESLVEGAAEA